jgi:hypothetical protein
MALVEKFHVVASDHAVAPLLNGQFNTIVEGMLVTLDADGIRPWTGWGDGMCLGVAGDTKSQSASGMPGIYTGWQNRVSDGYDETKASALITVYHSGGEFATDQFESDVENAAVGALLYGSTGGKLQATPLGPTHVAAIAVLTMAAGPYPSGVPGTDIQAGANSGDMALRGDNNNQYIEFKLLV